MERGKICIGRKLVLMRLLVSLEDLVGAVHVGTLVSIVNSMLVDLFCKSVKSLQGHDLFECDVEILKVRQILRKVKRSQITFRWVVNVFIHNHLLGIGPDAGVKNERWGSFSKVQGRHPNSQDHEG